MRVWPGFFMASLLCLSGANCPDAYAEANSALGAPLQRICGAVGETTSGVPSSLSNVSSALKQNHALSILTIGASATLSRNRETDGYYSIVEKYLKNNFKGIEVKILDIGVSGELASDAAERIKTEVALSDVKLVLWQVTKRRLQM
jgi:acyl-CoA thioesterase I